MILHCFSAPWRAADAAERGWYCSFAGHTTYPGVRRPARGGGTAARRADPGRDRRALPGAADRARQAQRTRLRRRHGPRRRRASAASPTRSWSGSSRPTPALSSAGRHRAWSGSARTFSPTPTCWRRSCATPSSTPADVVLEVGAGEGVLTERLAGGRRPRPRDRARPGAGAGAGADRRPPQRRAALGRRDEARPDRPGPGPDRGRLQPALLDRDAADPAHDRGAALGAALDGDGAARDRRPPASRRRAAATYGSPSVLVQLACEVTLLRTVDPAVFRPRPRVELGGPRPAAHRARRRCRHPRPRPRRLCPPPQVAGPLARARPPRLARPRCVPALAELGLPEDARAEQLSPGEFQALRRVDCPDRPMRIHAPAKLNLCLYLGPRREDGLHELCSLFEPLALADAIEVSDGRARRGRLRRASRGRTSPRGRWRRCASRAGTRRRCGSRSRSGSRSPPASAAAAPMPPRCCAWGGRGDGSRRLGSGPGRDRRRARRRRALAAEPCALAGSGRRREGRAAARARRPTPSSCCPSGGGLSTAAVFAEADRLGLGRGEEELSELAARLREAAGGGASPLDYAEQLLVNDLEPAARSLRPEIGDGARRPARGRCSRSPCSPAPGRPLSGSSRTLAGGRSRGGRSSTARTRSSARPVAPGKTAPSETATPGRPPQAPPAARRDRRRDRRRLLPDQPRHPPRRTPEPAGRRLQHARRLDLSAGRLLRLRRDRRLRRPRRARRDGDAARRRRRRAGRDRHLHPDRDRLVRRLGRATRPASSSAAASAASS